MIIQYLHFTLNATHSPHHRPPGVSLRTPANEFPGRKRRRPLLSEATHFFSALLNIILDVRGRDGAISIGPLRKIGAFRAIPSLTTSTGELTTLNLPCNFHTF